MLLVVVVEKNNFMRTTIGWLDRVIVVHSNQITGGFTKKKEKRKREDIQ